MPDFLFDFQGALVEWALRKGRSAILADCGLGKTPMLLTWAENIVRKTNGAVLILTPLAVASQTLREAEKFGIECKRADANSRGPGIFVTNYQRLHHLDPSNFVGVVCDESSILKSFDGTTRAAVTEFMRKLPYRLLCTATAAPNDYTELGTSSEALGYLGHMDMLNRFFVNDRNNSHTGRAWATTGGGAAQWRFRGHAERPFWRWVCSWARSLRRPSDLGFDDSRFALPPLEEREHIVKATCPRPGELFARPAIGLAEQREERRRTLRERCERVASLVADRADSTVCWTHLNDEGDIVEELLPFSVQISGSDTEDYREAALEWFSGDRCLCDDERFKGKRDAWQREDRRVTGNVTTPSIENSVSLNQPHISERMPTPAESTNGGISDSTPSVQMSRQGDEPSVARNMHQTPLCAPPISWRPRNTDCETQANGTNKTFASSESMETSSGKCLPRRDMVAQSADRDEATPPGNGLPSTTVTPLGSSGDSSVRTVTKELESSPIAQNGSSVQPCICGRRSGRRVLISKPVLSAWGLNWQHCAHMTCFASHSFEQYYQSVRRFWRFGQTRTVTVDHVVSDGEGDVLKNLQRKSAAADRLFSELTGHMRDELSIARSSHGFAKQEELPSWL